MNRLVGSLVVHHQNCCLLSPWNVSHYSTRVTSKSTSLFSSSGHHEAIVKTPMASVRSFSSNTDQPVTHDDKTSAESKPKSNSYRNKPDTHQDLHGRPFASHDIDNRWQGLLHDRETVNNSTMGFPSYSGPVVSLHSAMQSNVPKPYFPNDRSSFPTHQNMPGGGIEDQQKFLYGALHHAHPSKQKRDGSYPVKFAVPVQATTGVKSSHVPGIISQPDSADHQSRNQSSFEEVDVNTISHIHSSDSEHLTPSHSYPSSHNTQHSVGSGNETLNQKNVPDNYQTNIYPRHYIYSGSFENLESQVTYDAPCPQGIQGDDCVYFEQWMESCLRYGLSNCEEQLKNLKTGRKTLQQVLDEHQKIIEEVALNNKKKASLDQATSSRFTTYAAPVAIQSDAQQKCLFNSYEMVPYNSQQHHQHFRDSRNPVEEINCSRHEWTVLNPISIFSLQHHFQQHQQRTFSTSSWFSNLKGSNPAENKPEPNPTSTTAPTPDDVRASSETPTELTRRQKLQRAVKEYGSTVMVFHVTISLMSLGSFYLAVSSGIDLVGLMAKLGIGENILQSRLATGASTFVVAYAVHKVFAPARIAITLSATPLIVKYLRLKGFLKPPKPKPKTITK